MRCSLAATVILMVLGGVAAADPPDLRPYLCVGTEPTMLPPPLSAAEACIPWPVPFPP